jgi:hypothetical protein
LAAQWRRHARLIEWVNSNPHPLGLYVFAEDDDVIDQILSMTESGDTVVNDCSLHPLVPELPFGGVTVTAHNSIKPPGQSLVTFATRSAPGSDRTSCLCRSAGS